MILDDIVSAKIKQLEEIKKNVSQDELEKQISFMPVRDFGKALRKPNTVSIIAEIKKASPSKGIIKTNFNPLDIADAYEEARADAISVLTEMEYFLGKNEYLTQTKGQTSVPILRKDFIIDEYQIAESKALGADALLLIVAILEEDRLKKFIDLATQLQMSALVEVHDKDEVQKALTCGAEIIGINNRNLKTFETSLKHTEEIIPLISKGKIIISESGIHTREDIAYLKELGVNGVLIGESLMKADSIQRKIQELRGHI